MPPTTLVTYSTPFVTNVIVDEEAERKVVKAVSAKEAELYFNSKEGIVAMKKASQSILETR